MLVKICVLLILLKHNIAMQYCLTYNSTNNKCYVGDLANCRHIDSGFGLQYVSGCHNYCDINIATIDCYLCQSGRQYDNRLCYSRNSNNGWCYNHGTTYWTSQYDCNIFGNNCSTRYHYHCRYCNSLSSQLYNSGSRSCYNITTTPNCAVIEADSDCKICENGYAMNQDQKTCMQVDSSIQNCLNYDKFQCSICKDTFVYNRNYYAVQYDELNLAAQTNYEYLQHFALTTYRIQNHFVSQCEQKITIADCVSYLTGIKCKLCDKTTGLIPSSDMLSCVDPFRLFIEFCEIYNIEQIGCKLCQHKYYLSNGLCVRVDEVSNCFQYELNVCVECLSTHKLVNGSCTLRNTIQNCTQYHISEDYCLQCNTSYSLTSDQMSCVSTITNCKTHTKNALGQASCTQCNDYYTLNFFGFCYSGSVSNCKVYSQNNNCTQCEINYYLENSSSCVYNLIENCDLNDYYMEDVCTTCSFEYVLLQEYQPCVQIQTIANCLEYEFADKCKKCEDYYYLNETKTQCQPIDSSFNNCLQYDIFINKCVLCESEYAIVNGICIKNDEYFESCFESDQFGLNFNDYQCKICATNYAPIDLTDYYGCHSYKFMKEKGLTNPDQNCLKYGYDSNSLSFSCQLCNEGFYIRNSQCVSECQAGELIFKYTIQKIQVPNTFDYNYIKYSGINVCGSLLDQVANCTQVAPDIYFQSADYRKVTYSCIDCANGTLKIPKVKTAVAEYTPDINTTDGRLSKNPLKIFPGLACRSMGDVSLEGTLTGGYVDGCEYYVLLGFNDLTGDYSYGCLKCQFGKNGIIKRHQSSNRGYIEECKDFELQEAELGPIDGTCNNATFMFGFTHNQRDINWNQIPLETFLSCHTCVSPGVPYHLFLFISFEDISKFSTGTSFSYKKNSMKNHAMLLDYQMPNDPIPGRPLRCLQFDLDEMFNFKDPIPDSIKNQMFFVDYLTKCQLFIVNTLKYKYILSTYDPNPEVLKEIIYCGACKPGFKPLKFSPLDTGSFEISEQQYFYPYKVFDCQEISNCNLAAGKWVNNCEFCLEDYTWFWNNVTKSIEYDKCVFNNHSNCMAVDDRGLCQVCIKGFEFYEGSCVLFKANKCEDSETLFVRNFPVNSNQIDFARNYFYVRDKGKGCNKCQNDTQLTEDQRYVSFINIPSTLNRNQRIHCITNCSGQCEQNPLLWERLEFIPNCTYYKFITYPEYNTYGEEKIKIKCTQCNDGFALNTIYECIDATDFDNCIQIDEENNTCMQCQDGYLYENGKCVLPSIENCIEYNNNISSTSIICQKCIEKYYIDFETNTCVQGTIPNCKIYQSQTMCELCDDNYQNYIINNNKTECIQLYTEFSCLQLDQQQFLSSKYKCQQCIENYMPSLSTNTNPSETMCFSHPVVQFCIEYHILDTISNSTFQCLECQSQYYRDDLTNTCLQRTANYTYCDIRILNEDKCEQCILGYSLTADQRACEPNEIQISGCEKYYRERYCLECYNKYYLENNECIYVPPVNQVESCVKYEKTTTIKCSRCSSLYYLDVDTGLCKIGSVSDCEVLVDKSNCKYCMKDFQLFLKPNADPNLEGTYECKLLEVATGRPLNCDVADVEHPSICSVCINNTYAKKGVCTLVPADRLTANCLKYQLNSSNAIVCYLCDAGYYLYWVTDRYTCVQSSAQSEQPSSVHNDCRQLVKYDLAQCNSCQRGQHFDWDNNFETCVSNASSNCSIIRERDPGACNSCSNGRGHDGSACV